MSTMQRLELRQGHSLTMTPQLVQSIRLLQLSHAELIAYVEAELERNPLLQEAEAHGDAPLPSLADFQRAKQRYADSGGRMIPAPAPGRMMSSAASQGSSASHSDLNSELEETLAGAQSLTGFLEAQLDLACAEPELRAVARHLIHNLDEAGYLADDLGDVADRLGVPLDQTEAALKLLQTFEPSGIGARSLEECLEIQLRERDRLDPAMQILLSRLDLVARQDFASLRKACDVDQEDLAGMLAEIRRLEPKPGLAFAAVPIDVRVPDALVRRASDGSFVVELNPETLPRILLNRSYYAQVAQVLRKDDDRSFLTDCFQSASWLTRSLDQRAKTILTVATEIVRRQEDFFREGIASLRPMTLKSVAEAIGMHESTVSRVAANKAIGADGVTYPLKFFLNGATGEGGHAAEAVRHRIRQLIATEVPDQVLSDEAISHLLKTEGIHVARRTVAKYREAMHISSSMERRRKYRFRTS